MHRASEQEAMKALDEFMKNVVCHIIKSHTLPILKLRNNYSEDEGKEDSIHFADSDDEDSKNPENFRLLTSCTLPGMRKITQIISIASLVSTLKKGEFKASTLYVYVLQLIFHFGT